MKVALVHEFLVTWGGSDLVLDVFHDMFPQAPIYTAMYDQDRMPERFKSYDIHASFIQRIPKALKYHQRLIPLFPMAFEQFDLSDVDLVLTSHHSSAKNVITRPETLHVCFVHSPMRYGWGFYHEYLQREKPGRFTRMLLPPMMNYLRMNDVVAANRVDVFVANSHNVARRIEKYYRRESHVVHSPIEGHRFKVAPKEDFYLWVGRLVGYKRPDLAVEAFNQSGKKLVVIGSGPQLPLLQKMAAPNVQIMGFQSDEVVVDYLSRCRAFVFPGEEDFGLAPVEAMASGSPVVAFGKGGALETVKEGLSGVFFKEQTAASMNEAVDQLEKTTWDPEAIRRWGMTFDVSQFKEKMHSIITSSQRAFLG